MSKRVNFSARPKKEAANVSLDDWIAAGTKETVKSAETKTTGGNGATAKEAAEAEETTRFTIDIPVDLHARIKVQCAFKRVKMKDEIQALLEKHFPSQT